jgi:hypothetical protein
MNPSAPINGLTSVPFTKGRFHFSPSDLERDIGKCLPSDSDSSSEFAIHGDGLGRGHRGRNKADRNLNRTLRNEADQEALPWCARSSSIASRMLYPPHSRQGDAHKDSYQQPIDYDYDGHTEKQGGRYHQLLERKVR